LRYYFQVEVAKAYRSYQRWRNSGTGERGIGEDTRMTELITVILIVAAFACGWQSGASRQRVSDRLDRYLGLR